MTEPMDGLMAGRLSRSLALVSGTGIGTGTLSVDICFVYFYHFVILNYFYSANFVSSLKKSCRSVVPSSTVAIDRRTSSTD